MLIYRASLYQTIDAVTAAHFDQPSRARSTVGTTWLSGR